MSPQTETLRIPPDLRVEGRQDRWLLAEAAPVLRYPDGRVLAAIAPLRPDLLPN